MGENTFYDVHCHAMNLSHPNLLAFMQRVNLPCMLLFNTLLGPLASYFVEKNLRVVQNLLAVMENDIGDLFLLMEDCLGEAANPLCAEGRLRIGANVYERVVLTPPIMDFGLKDLKVESIHYNQPVKKPVVDQVVDLFNGIARYRALRPNGLFEIYPFLGLNTKNYVMRRAEDGNTIPKMLDKYFSAYTGRREDLRCNLGAFSGDIKELGSNFFAGVKLYPPLGFDPWPDKAGELEKVRYLYDYCSAKRIPVTAHCSEGGFEVVDKDEALKFTSPVKWEQVLSEYPQLRLNLAHFGKRPKFLGLFPQDDWLNAILRLMKSYSGLYTDFSCAGFDDEFYAGLRETIAKRAQETDMKLMDRILFGSDFMINLLWTESYNKYLDVFSRTPSFSDDEKDMFCQVNPERFLFGA